LIASCGTSGGTNRKSPAYAALGVPNPEARVEAFYFAVERFVVRRLTRLGLDGPLAWMDRYGTSAIAPDLVERAVRLAPATSGIPPAATTPHTA
jgi:hypothetical protein